MIDVKSYKFRLGGIDFNVTVEEKRNDAASLTPPTNDYLGTHYHAGYEWFFVTRSPLSVYTESGVRRFENGLVSVPPYFIHRADNNGNFKFSFSFKPSKEENGDFSRFMLDNFPTEEITTAKISENVTGYIPALEAAFSSNLEISTEMAESLIKLIFSDIFLTNAENIHSTQAQTNADYLVKIDNTISKFKNDITLTVLSEAVQTSSMMVIFIGVQALSMGILIVVVVLKNKKQQS